MASNALEIIGPVILPDGKEIALTGLAANLERIAHLFTPGHPNRKFIEDAAIIVGLYQASVPVEYNGV